MKRLFLLLAALPLVACTTTSNELNQNLEPLPAKAISYQCDSGNRIIVTYPDNETAEVKYMDDTYQMKIAISASGAAMSVMALSGGRRGMKPACTRRSTIPKQVTRSKTARRS